MGNSRRRRSLSRGRLSSCSMATTTQTRCARRRRWTLRWSACSRPEGGPVPEVSEILNAVFEELEERRPTEAPEVWARGYSLFQSEGMRRRSMASAALTLYHGHARHSLGGDAALFADDVEPPGYNLIQAAVDTKTAHVVRNKVRPMFVTERGDSKLRKKALGMQRAVEAVFQQTGVYGETGVSVCRDGNLFDAGGMKFFVDAANSCVRGERVFAHDVLVDPDEAKLGNPRQMWHAQVIDRRVLMRRFADNAQAVEAIRAAPPASYDQVSREDLRGQMEIADMVLVLEYWRLPAGNVKTTERRAFGRDEDGNLAPDIDPGHDGKHMICLQNDALLDEPWPFDYFPFAWYKPMKNAVGYWSRGIPETLAGTQLQINKYN